MEESNEKQETGLETTESTSTSSNEETKGGEVVHSLKGGISEEKGDGNRVHAEVQKAKGAHPEVQEWSPSYKFKIKDKEQEFDDFVKPVVKTKDLEDKLRSLYEKAYGLDEVKTSRESFKQQVEEWKGKYGQVEQSLKTLGDYVKKGDFNTFFGALNIPKDKIIQYAIEELKYQELPQDQRQAIDLQRQQQTEFERAQTLNQTLQQQMSQMVQRQTEFELNQALASPDVAAAISSYETLVGKPGIIRNEIIKRGQYYELTQKESPSARQLVDEVLGLITNQANSTTPSASASISTPGQVVQKQKEKPVISSFQGGAKSPAKKVPTSIEDLRKMRQQLHNN